MRLHLLTLLSLGVAISGPITAPAFAEDTGLAMVTGAFQDADRRHQGAGTATLVVDEDGKVVLQFDDFEVTPGPDLEVWLVVDPTPATSAAVLASEWVSLGSLQSPQGPQTYDLPEDVDATAYGSVVIWCEDFSVLFAVASFEQAPTQKHLTTRP